VREKGKALGTEERKFMLSTKFAGFVRKLNSLKDDFCADNL